MTSQIFAQTTHVALPLTKVVDPHCAHISKGAANKQFAPPRRKARAATWFCGCFEAHVLRATTKKGLQLYWTKQLNAPSQLPVTPYVKSWQSAYALSRINIFNFNRPMALARCGTVEVTRPHVIWDINLRLGSGTETGKHHRHLE